MAELSDIRDDLRGVTEYALSTIGARGATREVIKAQSGRLEAALQELGRLREICTDEEPEKPGELDRLNPYKRGWVENPAPKEQPANFIHGVRYYLGMLEDGDSWPHPLGHIESLCREFQVAIDARAGRTQVATVTDAQLAADIESLRHVIKLAVQFAPVSTFADLSWEMLDRITAALAERGGR